MELDEYKKYKWFFTSTGKLVVGGKNAGQNDDLLRSIKESGKEYVVMHTSHPGSPFCIIISDVNKINKKDVEECAIFCGSFSRAWKEGKKMTEVHIFKASQVSKERSMKTGTWRVSGEIQNAKVELSLVLTRQKNILRAVPENSVSKKDVIIKICPGKIDKRDMLAKIQLETDEEMKAEELLAALPAGGVRVCK